MTNPRESMPMNISATADTFVHYLFASPGNETILCSFVNAVQDNAGLPPVKETRVLNPFNPKTFLTDKRSIIDIKAIAKNDRLFVIEFQVAEHVAFVNRALYYWSKTYGGQLKEGDAYERLNPVAMMILTRFLLFGELDELHNTFWITAQNRPEFVLTGDLQIHTLELVEEKIGQINLINEPLRKWLEFFYTADKKSEAEMKILLKDTDPALQQAYDRYVRFTQNEELRQLEDARQMYLHDFNSAVSYAEQKGREEGLAEGQIETLLRILTKRFGKVSQSIIAGLHGISNMDRLAELTDLSLDCSTLEEFETALK